MKKIAFIVVSFLSLTGCHCSTDLPCTLVAWETPPKPDELYMLIAGESAFEKDFLVTCILQRWGDNNFIPEHHKNGWMKIKKDKIQNLIDLGFRVIFLPNGKEDLPYLDLTTPEIHSPPFLEK